MKVTWKPKVTENRWGFYVSRRRKGKDAEYLHRDRTWRLYAEYYESANAAYAELQSFERLDPAMDSWWPKPMRS